MNILQRFLAKTPSRNKQIGRLLTLLMGMLTAIEGVLLAYNIPAPDWIHQTIIASAVVSGLLSGYHGQKVKK
jgi:hypothetical protein